ncbi:thioredoxin H9 isoform X3 [Coffea arabica]|uniref:Thioredoxin H9 isoform X3 n=1 Tax=Coffea arabica TaxID=13443 RepID=A0ABM4UKT0_COFAR
MGCCLPKVIANFSASWCGPCRMVAPFYCELSEKHPTLMFLTIDVDELTVSDDATVIWSDATGNHAMRIFAAGSFGWITCDYAVMSIQEEFSASWDIKATPTFFFLKDGQQIDKLVGANKPELQKKITSIVDSESTLQK